jgi:two-component system chemotaxis sensor kinase CheA
MDDLIADFLAEAEEGLEQIDNDLLTLESDPNDAEVVGSIFRIMHTIKGTCGFLGLPKLEKVAHVAENVMDKIRNRELNANEQIVTVVFEAIDTIKGIISYIKASGGEEPEDDFKAVIEKLDAIYNGTSPAIAGNTAAEPSQAEPTPAGPAEAAPPEQAESAPEEAPAAQQPQAEIASEPQPVAVEAEPAPEQPAAPAPEATNQEADEVAGEDPAVAAGPAESPPEPSQPVADQEPVAEAMVAEPVPEETVDDEMAAEVMVDTLEKPAEAVESADPNAVDAEASSPEPESAEQAETKEEAVEVPEQPQSESAELPQAEVEAPAAAPAVEAQPEEVATAAPAAAVETEPEEVAAAAPAEAVEKEPVPKEEPKPAAAAKEVSEKSEEPAPAPAPPPPAAPKVEAKKPAEKPSAKPAAAKEPPKESIRVSLEILEDLMQSVSELVLTRNQLLQLSRRNQESTIFQGPLQHLNLITTELQENVMKTRMQPINNVWSAYPRVVRDLSKELGKKIELVMEGKETELDRHLIEMIKDPLTHMMRNSVDHGIEMPDQRLAAGKSETGTITLNAYHSGGHVIIEIIDDGKGLSSERIKQKAIDNNLATSAEIENMSEKQIHQFIFHAGFSTADQVTSVSGRGVGMDVVKTNIEKIGGTIELDSKEGKGSTFTIKIPLTLAIMPVLIISTEEVKFAIPQINVMEIIKVNHGNSNVNIEILNDAPIIKLREKLVPLIFLGNSLGLRAYSEEEAISRVAYIVVCKVGAMRYGLVVDKVFDTEEIVVKPVSNAIKDVREYSGNTILGDGSVIMLLDPNGLSKNISTKHQVDDREEEEKVAREKEQQKTASNLLLFKSNDGIDRAIPLEVVARLEEIDLDNIEYAIGMPILQYRDQLMKLVSLEGNFGSEDETMRQVIVFTDGEQSLGLVVKEILDIIPHDFNNKIAKSNDPKFVGSLVLNGKATDMVNISYFFNEAYGEYDAEEAQARGIKHVLLVDDSAFFRKFIPPAIKSEGYRVTTVDDGLVAWEYLEANNDVDVVISDLNMPNLSGPELAARMKESVQYRDIPIIALSSYTTEEMLENPEEVENFDAYISKTHHSHLIEKLHELAGTEKKVKDAKNPLVSKEGDIKEAGNA